VKTFFRLILNAVVGQGIRSRNMSYLRGRDRSEVQLLPPCLDDYVGPGAPARFIDAFVEGLDLQALGFTHAQPATTGRPPYHPADLLKLYLYGYLNRIRSSRRLEAETARNLELMWLLRGLGPDFKTIADFRKDNRAAFKPLFKQFNLLCRKLELFGAELVAIDGSKFKALNNIRRHYTQEQLQELVQKIETRIEDYLGQMDHQDLDAQGVAEAPSQQALQDKIAELKTRQTKYEDLLQAMAQVGQSEVSLSDPDSRGQKKIGIGYNVQVAVDARHHLIVEPTVVQDANDRGQLSSMAAAAKQELGVDQLKVVADAGYHEAGELQSCEQASIQTFVSAPGSTSGHNSAGQEVYPKESFKYDGQTDRYQCPAGQHLERGYQAESKGKERIYYYNIGACRACPQKGSCTSAVYRKISRLVNEAVVERQAARTAANPQIIKARKGIVEHVFGTLRNWEHDCFLMRGLEKVRAEFSLSALVYNLRRVLNLIGLERWLEVVAAGFKTAQTAPI
jgi:transposase